MVFSEYIGMQNNTGAPGSRIDIEPHHMNPTGNVNGGVIISLADNLATGTAGDEYFKKFGERAFLVGIDLHAVMLANQHGGTITATSTPIRVGRRVTVIRTIVHGSEGKALAEVTTTHVPTPSPNK
ncbi:MAG: 1,4-dihydroxy-2-naphthoyl-CoA hydrolase [Candidatus Azotimanducaceae bacterium]|jgi:1,4-dihydroxy-2-naphthoyl-CoA hydrolase